MNKELYKQAIEKFGVEAQIWMAIEERSELIQAICKKKRGKSHNIEEEIVDCIIVLEQLKTYFEFDFKNYIFDKEEINDRTIVFRLNTIKNSLIQYTEHNNPKMFQSGFYYTLWTIKQYSEQFDKKKIKQYMQIKEVRLKELIERS